MPRLGGLRVAASAKAGISRFTDEDKMFFLRRVKTHGGSPQVGHRWPFLTLPLRHWHFCPCLRERFGSRRVISASVGKKIIRVSVAMEDLHRSITYLPENHKSAKYMFLRLETISEIKLLENG